MNFYTKDIIDNFLENKGTNFSINDVFFPT